MENNPTYQFEIPDEWKRHEVFALPEGYFNAFPAKIIAAIRNSQQMQVPEGYFDALPDKLMQAIRQKAFQNELEEIAPTIASLPKNMPFRLPDNYFENLKPSVAPQRSSAPIIRLRRIISWAAAACVVALLALSAYYFAIDQSANPAPTEIAGSLEALPDEVFEELVKSTDAVGTNSLYVAVGWKAPEEALENFSIDDLKKYLENSGIDNLYEN